MDARHKAAIPLFHRNHVIAEIRPHAEKAGDLVLLAEVLELLRERQIGETVAVVGQVFLFPFEVLFDCLQPLANIRIHARIGERDAPVVNVAIEEPQVLASGLQGEIVRDTLVVVQEIVLHDIGAIAQAKNEVFVSEVRICFITCHRIGR